jgi:hypothetical protein
MQLRSDRTTLHIKPLFTDSTGYSFDDTLNIGFDLMLPDPDDRPTHSTKLCEIPLVSFPGFADLSFPEIGQRLFPSWESVAMPKVPI